MPQHYARQRVLLSKRHTSPMARQPPTRSNRVFDTQSFEARRQRRGLDAKQRRRLMFAGTFALADLQCRNDIGAITGQPFVLGVNARVKAGRGIRIPGVRVVRLIGKIELQSVAAGLTQVVFSVSIVPTNPLPGRFENERMPPFLTRANSSNGAQRCRGRFLVVPNANVGPSRTAARLN